MNKTKFKAWDKSRQHPCMIEVEAVMYDEFDKMSICGKPFDEDNGGFTHLEEGEFDLIQYTGLKDVNGVEIYEGDIVKAGNFLAQIRYTDLSCGFVAARLNDFNTYSDYPQPFLKQCRPEIIGNIYENKELTK